MRWAAERQDVEFLPQLESMLKEPELRSSEFPTIVSTVSYLKNGTARSGVRDEARENVLINIASNSRYDAKTRALAIRMLPAGAEIPTANQLSQWLLDSNDSRLHQEIVMLLLQRGTAK